MLKSYFYYRLITLNYNEMGEGEIVSKE